MVAIVLAALEIYKIITKDLINKSLNIISDPKPLSFQKTNILMVSSKSISRISNRQEGHFQFQLVTEIEITKPLNKVLKQVNCVKKLSFNHQI